MNMQKPYQWQTIILCIIFVITGQFITKLLENFYYDHQIQRKDYNQYDGVWTLSLLRTVGFPLLLLPFFIFNTKKHIQQPPITSDRSSSSKFIFSFSASIGLLMTNQVRLSGNGKIELPFRVFTLMYTTQLFFTPILTAFINKSKFNRWVVISLLLAIVTGALSFSFPDKEEENHARDSRTALLSGVYFSLILCVIEYVFKYTESSPTRKQSFASVFQVIIFSSIFATLISVVGLLIAGEQHDFKKEMNGFSKGKSAYVMTMVGQAVSWQIYWVGIVGLVFSVSSVLSNVIFVITWPIVSALVLIFFKFYGH